MQLGEPKEEWEVLEELVNKLPPPPIALIGAGIYEHYIPAEVRYIAKRSEFLTAYTPYQPEASQGTLEVIFKFQSIISNITGFEVTNAGMWDVPTAIIEAIILGSRVKNSKRVMLPATLNPFYRRVIKTHLPDFDFIETGFNPLTGKTEFMEADIILLQNPNFFGVLEDKNEFEKLKGFKIYISDDPNFLIFLKPFDADVFIGNAQPLGNPVACGGEHAGIFSTKMEYIRLLPGRLVAETFDIEGNKAYTLTLQTREQHIRKEKATSNICTNNELNIIASTICLMMLGKEGIKRICDRCIKNLEKIKEVSAPVFTGVTLYEATFKVKRDICNELKKNGIYFGVNIESFYPELAGMKKEDEEIRLVYVPDTLNKKTLDYIISKLK